MDKLLPINKHKGICIYEPEAGQSLNARSIKEIPYGDIIKPKYTEESKKKMSESAKKRGAPKAAFRDKSGCNNPMFGKSQSEESRSKQSKSRKANGKNNPFYGCKGKQAYYNKNTLKIKYYTKTESINRKNRKRI